MTQPILSILIPTVVGRVEDFERLFSKISKYGTFKMYVRADLNRSILSYKFDDDLLEIVKYFDDKKITIGEKRERLYKMSSGIYSWQIDDDDEIAPNAIELILKAIKSNPEVDVITFEEYVNIDGKEYKSNHSNEYADWEGDGNSLFADGFHFHRTPFFKSVIKTEIAKSVPIPHIRFGEDHQWAQALKPHIKSEIHIPEPLYRYIHISSPHNERYGII